MDMTQRLLHERVATVDHRDLISVSKNTKVSEAIQRMKTHRVGCVVVVDDAGRPDGTFTERLVVKLLLGGAGATAGRHAEVMDTPVADHMLTPPVTVSPDTSVAELIDRMESSKLRFVCVVNAEGKSEAVVGQKGVTKFLASHYPQVVQGNSMESSLHVKTREGA